jgi:transcriptional regulator with XRE-family HTH domain
MHIGVTSQEVVLRLRELMKAEGLSQRDLASRLGMSQGHLSKVLRNGFGPHARLPRQVSDLISSSEGVSTRARDLERAFWRATEGSSEAKRILFQMMHLIGELRRLPSR